MTTHADPGTVASEHARDLVRGAYDLHVHVSPDVMERRIDDVGLARRFAKVGQDGVVLKSHYLSTAERAAVVRGIVPGVDVLGAITLNGAMGGLNPLAVEIAGREGARVVWLPTVDAVNQRAHRKPLPPGASPPLWAQLQDDLKARGMEADPVPVVDEAGEPLPELRAVLRTVAAHQMVLATGHLSRDEIFTVVEAAKEEGVRDVVVTHPEFPSQSLSAADQIALAERGAWLERCFTTAHTGKVEWQTVFDNVRAAGVEHSFLSTDLGQPENPPVEDGLALLADRFLAAGFSADEVRTLAVTNTRRIAGVPVS
jgi:hypothetical protein